jgi:hypothetical protein
MNISHALKFKQKKQQTKTEWQQSIKLKEQLWLELEQRFEEAVLSYYFERVKSEIHEQ